MKIYFKEFGGHGSPELFYLTPNKHYDIICDAAANEEVYGYIKDDNGCKILAHKGLCYHIGTEWHVVNEDDILEKVLQRYEYLKSERDALLNSVKQANDLLDQLYIPKQETLSKRIYHALFVSPLIKK